MPFYTAAAIKSCVVVLVRCSLREPKQEEKRKKQAEPLACPAFGLWFDKIELYMDSCNATLKGNAWSVRY
jgi:hypothetical protein